MKYCESCNQNVMPAKKFSIGWFLVNCLWLVGGVVYIFYFIFGKKKVCPICGGNHLENKRENIISVDGIPVISKEEQWDNKVLNMNEKAKAAKIISGSKRAAAELKNVEAKAKLHASMQKVKDESTARKLAKEQKKLNKVT